MRYPIQPGVCRFCGEEPDGDKFSFLDAKRTRCSRYRCILLWEAERERLIREEQARLRKIRDITREWPGRRKHRKVKGRAA